MKITRRCRYHNSVNFHWNHHGIYPITRPLIKSSMHSRVTSVLCTKSRWHYGDVTMSTILSQITSLAIVYSTVYSWRRSKKHQSSASLAFVWGNHRWPVNSPHKGPVTRQMFPFDDVIMKLDRQITACDCSIMENRLREIAVNPLALSDAIWRHRAWHGQQWFRYGLLHDGTKPLHEPMLTNQLDSPGFTWE